MPAFFFALRPGAGEDAPATAGGTPALPFLGRDAAIYRFAFLSSGLWS